ncbi:MAG: hypothetical protein LQ341_000015 [Variospora aurantia]|nr:MAG: hypothetical protein LQ341_000015 [Variospora aurantia]
MPTTNEADHFFQTTHSITETERKSRKGTNKNGAPVRIPSKILAAVADPSCPSDAVFVAESAGNVRRVVVDVGSWDKTIWSWSLASRQPLVRYRGHMDFVKCVITLKLDLNDIVISGGADASIIVWAIDTGDKLHTLKGHTRGILDLAVDPISQNDNDGLRHGPKEVIVFSAGSDREIRRWRIGLETAEQMDADNPILAHETSVYALRFDADGDLWTASADGTAKCLSRSHQFRADTTILHGDYVRAVALEEIGGYVLTAGRSEDIMVWDRGTGDLVHVFEGHYEEVTGLVMSGQRCVSVGIDGTVRTWSVKLSDLQNARKKKEKDQQALMAGEDVDDGKQKEAGSEVGLTEEEERELAELMQDDG